MPPRLAGRAWRAFILPASLSTLLTNAARAQVIETNVRVGGFGSVSYGNSSGYQYLSGTDKGEFNNAQYSILLTSAVSDRLTTAALIDLSLRGDTHDVDFSYAFASWRLSPSFEVRLGRVKHPGMLYSEVFNVGTVRPFLNLPPAIYGETGHAFENYTGAGLHGTLYPGAWQVAVSLYGGGGLYRYQSPTVDASLAPDAEAGRVPVRNMVGGRVTVRPPVHGLAVGGSAARGDATPSYSDDQTFTSTAAHVEYLTSRVWVRAETAVLSADAVFRFRSEASYLEVAAFVTDRIQPAVLVDRVRDVVEGTSQLPSRLQQHDGVAFGLNFWISPNFVVKTSAHTAHGNRLTWPRRGALMPAIMSGSVVNRTRLFQLGAQYSF